MMAIGVSSVMGLENTRQVSETTLNVFLEFAELLLGWARANKTPTADLKGEDWNKPSQSPQKKNNFLHEVSVEMVGIGIK